MENRRWWRGLQARITIAYAVGALLLSTVVAVTSFTIAQSNLLASTKTSAQEQFRQNARIVRDDLEAIALQGAEDEGAEYAELIEEIVLGDSFKLLYPPESSSAVGRVPGDREPIALESAVVQLKVADIVYELPASSQPDEPANSEAGNTLYAMGVSFDGLSASYYEVVSLQELEQTLTDLRRILFATAVAASLAGAALGYYSARRALAPVNRISNAAQAIAEGDFGTRLDLSIDPDLAVLSQSFNEMVDALQARIQRDERFTSDVSHELRSPLMTLTASLEVLERRKGSLPEVAQRAVGLLRDDLNRFEHLVEDLLEISRMDAGAAHLDLSHFGLAEFLINVIAQSRSPEIELITPDGDEEVWITADKRRLAQVITNLVDNASKYAGGATAIRFRQVGDNVLIMVEDEGPGVSPEDRERIFDRFSRAGADAGRRSGDSGVGLGLSLVSEHVRLHSGRVWVTERTDGKSGARFVVEMPVGEYNEDLEEMAL